MVVVEYTDEKNRKDIIDQYKDLQLVEDRIEKDRKILIFIEKQITLNDLINILKKKNIITDKDLIL
jgi:hypothetical protein